MYDPIYENQVITSIGMAREKLGVAGLDYNANLTLVMSRDFYANLLKNTRDYVPSPMNKKNKIYGCEILIDYAAEVNFRVVMDL